MGNTTFAERIKAMREKHNLTTTDLAKKLNISKTRVSMWETSGTVPRQDVLFKLCELFDVSSDYLLGNDKTDGNNPRNAKINSIQRLLVTLNENELDKAENLLNIAFDKKFEGK